MSLFISLKAIVSYSITLRSPRRIMFNPFAAKNLASFWQVSISPIKAHDPYPYTFLIDDLSKEWRPDTKDLTPFKALTLSPMVVKNPTITANLLNVLASSLWSDKSGSHELIFSRDDPIKSSRMYLINCDIMINYGYEICWYNYYSKFPLIFKVLFVNKTIKHPIFNFSLMIFKLLRSKIESIAISII